MGTLRGRAGPVITVMLLFLVFAVFALIRQRGAQPEYPTGSTRSSAADGARALALWLEASGARVGRLEGNQSVARAQPNALLLIQPPFGVGAAGRAAFEDVAQRGGTVVLAGHSPTTLEYAAQLGVRTRLTGSTIADATTPATSAVPTAPAPALGAASPLTVSVRTRVSLELAAGARPLLEAPDGRVVALRTPYRRGTLVVIASPLPLTNEGLRDPDTARFVYREIISPLTAQAAGAPGTPRAPSVLFDESLHVDPRGGLSPDASLTSRVQRFVLRTPLGWAAAYAGMLVFLYLLLSGRRLGPALRPVRAGAASRTMYEHVQALAGLYRRGGQFLALRAHFARHYRRRIARALGTAAVLDGPVSAADLVERGLAPAAAQAIAHAVHAVDGATHERDLAEAVRRADAALERLRTGGYPHAHPQETAA